MVPVVDEAKYVSDPSASPSYGHTTDGPQMSDGWVENRLEQAVGRELADQILLESYEKWELRVSPDGNVRRQEVDR